MRPCCRGSAYSPVTAEVGGQYPSDAPFYPRILGCKLNSAIKDSMAYIVLLSKKHLNAC